MKRLYGLLILFLLAGCTSTIQIKPDGSLTATDYAIVFSADGSKAATPSRMFQGQQITDMFSEVLKLATFQPKASTPCPPCPACPPEKVCPDCPPVSPSPGTTPIPPGPIPPQPTGNLAVIDMNTEPGELRQYLGINAGDGSIWYVANCHELAPGWEAWSPEGPDGLALAGTGDKIRAWLNGKINQVVAAMKANPSQTVTVILNDGPDRCGSRVGPPIGERLRQAGIDPGRITLGNIYYP